MFKGIFFSSEIFSATILTKEGSFLFPLNGSGARYGESVSISNFSKGICFTISCRAKAFLKVTIPEIEIYKPKSKHSCANSILSELKQ